MTDLLDQIANAIAPLSGVLTSLVVTLIGSFVVWIFRAKVKITYGSASLNFHSFKLREDGEPISISTEKFYVQNVGRKAAQDVEIVFTAVPSSYNLWPPRDHVSKLLSQGEFAILVPSLAPKQLLIVDIVDIDLTNPKILTVNCPDAISEKVEYFPIRQYGNLFNVFIAILMFSGLVSIVYLLLRILFLGAK